ncbi:hypothetical protein Q4485_02305 [Granulosicoccaceae sp. 1_MG-2023]|nr:hypothetical protein [Granulosicoccaceae sp. 1_MG-2023]
MARRQPKQSLTELPALLSDLALATPQVIAARLCLFGSAGPQLNQHEQREFFEMINEKVTGFSESWHTLWLESMKLHQRMFFDVLSFSPATPEHTADSIGNWHRTAFDALPVSVLRPIHERATANAARLSAG